MGPQNFDWCPKVSLILCFWCQFALIWRRPWWLSEQICAYEWNLGLPLHTWNKATVKAMKHLTRPLQRRPRSSSRPGKSGHQFLGMPMKFCWWIYFSKGSYSNCTSLCDVIQQLYKSMRRHTVTVQVYVTSYSNYKSMWCHTVTVQVYVMSYSNCTCLCDVIQ